MKRDKVEMIARLRSEYDRWGELLDGMSDEQLMSPKLEGDWSIKDVMGHLMEWQKVSSGKLELARSGGAPVFPGWLAGKSPDEEGQIDNFNARIYAEHDKEDWATVGPAWREGFLRFVELGEAIPDADLMDEAKYEWLDGYAPYDVLEGSYEHHMEHREELTKWLKNVGVGPRMV